MQSVGPAFTRPVYVLPVALTLAVSTAAVNINANSIPIDASGFIIGNVSNDVNWAFGVNPTATQGIPLPAKTSLVIEDVPAADIPSFRFIRATNDSTLFIQWIAARNIARG